MMKKLYVHIGAHRTGTTYVQNAVHLNSPEFARHGIDTLTDLAVWGQGQHNVAWSYLGWAVRDDPRTADQYRRMFWERIRSTALDALFLSSEFFELFDDDAIGRFKADTDELDTVIVYAIRNQPDYLRSYYSESLKHAVTDQFEVWLEKRLSEGLGNFYDVTRRWSDGLPGATVRLVLYDDLVRRQANIFAFFAQKILSLPATASLRLPSQNWINRSIDSQLQWLMREMNIRYGSEESHVTGIGTRYLLLRRRLERAYAAISARDERGSSTQLDPLTVREIEARFDASNGRLLREFAPSICNPMAGGTLFPERAPASTIRVEALEPIEESQLLDLLFALLSND